MMWREFGIPFPVVPQKQEHNECVIHHSNPSPLISAVRCDICVCVCHFLCLPGRGTGEVLGFGRSQQTHRAPGLADFPPRYELMWDCRDWYKQLPEQHTELVFVPPLACLPSNVVLCIQREFLMGNYLSMLCFLLLSGAS